MACLVEAPYKRLINVLQMLLYNKEKFAIISFKREHVDYNYYTTALWCSRIRRCWFIFYSSTHPIIYYNINYKAKALILIHDCSYNNSFHIACTGHASHNLIINKSETCSLINKNMYSMIHWINESTDVFY